MTNSSKILLSTLEGYRRSMPGAKFGSLSWITTFGGSGWPRQIDFRVMKSGSMAEIRVAVQLRL
jgi:hypothetical protein